MFSEITIVVKDSEKTLRKKFPVYERYEVNDSDPVIRSCIKEVLENFDGEPDIVQVKIDLLIT